MTPQSPPVAEPKFKAIDETVAPSPLPEVLPAGTVWTGVNTGTRFVFTNGATLHHSREKYEGFSPDFGNAQPVISLIDWPSYYAALRSPPAPPEADRLHAEGCALCGDEQTIRRATGPHTGVGVCWGCRGDFPATTGQADPLDAEITRRKSLAKDAPAIPEHELPRDSVVCNRTKPLVNGKCPCLACWSARQERRNTGEVVPEPVHQLPVKRGPNGFGSSSDAKPDPYASHPSPSPHWLHEQAHLAAAKLDSARADLDRPMREKRYGKPLAGGWDSDDVDDGYCTF